MKNETEIQACIVEAIKEVLSDPSESVIDGRTDPIQHLGLDSFDGVACACSLSDKLGYEIPTNINPFVDDERRKSRCISEMVKVLMKLMRQKEETLDE